MAKKKLDDETIDEARAYFGEELLDGTIADTKWKRGTSGNPRGRPVEPDNLVDMLIWRLGKAGAKRLADHLIELALTGSTSVSLQATQYIYDRIEGKPRQAVLQQTEDEPAIVKLLRQMVDENRALEGRDLPAPLIGPVVTAEVREVPS